MEKLRIFDSFRPAGRVTLSEFEPGAIAYALSRGLSLHEAICEATRNGWLKSVQHTNNLVTVVGKQLMAGRMTPGGETVGLTYMAIGSGTTAPDASDVALETEVARKVLTECYQGDGFVFSSVFLLKSECSFYLKEGGIFGGAEADGDPDSGILFCRFLLDKDNSAGESDLTIQHTLEVQ